MIANQFTADSRDDISSVTRLNSISSNATILTSVHETSSDNDLINNDAYGNAAIDLGLVFSREALRDDEPPQFYPNKAAMDSETDGTKSASLSTDC